MRFLSKKEIKNYHPFMEKNILYCLKCKINKVLFHKYNVLNCDISGWYHNRGIDCNDRGIYIRELKKLFGESYRYNGFRRYTNYGVECKNGVVLIIETSIHGTSFSFIKETVKSFPELVDAVEELRNHMCLPPFI